MSVWQARWPRLLGGKGEQGGEAGGSGRARAARRQRGQTTTAERTWSVGRPARGQGRGWWWMGDVVLKGAGTSFLVARRGGKAR